jgi:hypothetical protein
MPERSTVYANANGVRRTAIVDDEAPGRLVVRTEQVLDEILPSIERDRALHRERTLNKVLARIPIFIYERSVLEQWDEGDWKRWLNSSDAAPFRIWGGQV